MEQYPQTIMEFERDFSTEDACLEYIYRLRWPEGFRCPRCGFSEAWKTERGLYHCKQCQHQSSVTAGTIFQDTRKPLRLWFRAIWHITNQKHGISALGPQRLLGLGSYHTAWFWMHKLRHAMVRPGRDRLSGTIEVDETYIGGEKLGKRGRGAAGKTLVVIAVQEDDKRIGRIRLLRVPDTSANSLAGAVQACIKPGSIVRTDGLRSYGQPDTLGYTHIVARKESGIGENLLLPLANRAASLLKRWLLGTHQGAVQMSHLDYYLDEFTFRFNRRRSRSRGKLFYRLLQQAVMIDPLPGSSISIREPNV